MENFKSKCTIRLIVRADDPGAVRYMVCYYTLKWFQEKLSHCLQIFRHSCYPRWPRVYNPDEWIGLYEHLFSLQGWKSVVLVTIEKSSQLWLYLEPWHPPTPITSRGTVSCVQTVSYAQHVFHELENIFLELSLSVRVAIVYFRTIEMKLKLWYFF